MMNTIQTNNSNEQKINLALFLAEPVDNEQAYIEKLVKAFEKVIKDELTSVIYYVKVTQLIPSKSIQNELVKHTFEEFKHYSMLIDYAHNHGFLKDIKINVDLQAINCNQCYDVGDYKGVVKIIQSMEENAINDYEVLIAYTGAYQDHDTYELIETILKDEREHFDDLSYILEQKRKVITKFSRPKVSKPKNKFSVIDINNNNNIEFSNVNDMYDTDNLVDDII